MTVKKYCYREPNFPESAYLALVFVSSGDDLRFLYPMMPLYPSLSVLRIEIDNFKKKLNKEKKLKIYGVLVAKITLNKKFPLKREHWTFPENSPLKIDFRLNQFMDMMKSVPQLYQVIVLPNAYDKKLKRWNFINWIPILISLDDKKIDDLIKASDQPVDESAKYLGLYSIEDTKGFDLVTGKLIEPNKKTIDRVADC